MPVRVNEFVIQAKFESEEDNGSPDDVSSGSSDSSSDSLSDDLQAMKEEIISECMEKFETFLSKREGR